LVYIIPLRSAVTDPLLIQLTTMSSFSFLVYPYFKVAREILISLVITPMKISRILYPTTLPYISLNSKEAPDGPKIRGWKNYQAIASSLLGFVSSQNFWHMYPKATQQVIRAFVNPVISQTSIMVMAKKMMYKVLTYLIHGYWQYLKKNDVKPMRIPATSPPTYSAIITPIVTARLV